MIEKLLTAKEKSLLKVVKSHLLHSGITPSIRTLMREMEYRSTRSVTLLLENLIQKGFLKRLLNKELKIIKQGEQLNAETTILVPLVGTVSCGVPIFAEENIEMQIPVSEKIIKKNSEYFFLNADGDSMNNKGINDGDLVLIKKQNTANKGDLVVALINDSATIKEFYPEGSLIILKPHSTNPMHKPIILDNDFIIQGIVVNSISKNIF